MKDDNPKIYNYHYLTILNSLIEASDSMVRFAQELSYNDDNQDTVQDAFETIQIFLPKLCGKEARLAELPFGVLESSQHFLDDFDSVKSEIDSGAMKNLCKKIHDYYQALIDVHDLRVTIIEE